MVREAGRAAPFRKSRRDCAVLDSFDIAATSALIKGKIELENPKKTRVKVTYMRATLLVMAAGMGSRYGGLKQIEPVGPNGEMIIDYSIYDAVRAGFDKVVFVVREDIRAEFEDVVGRRYQGTVPVAYVCQDLTDLPKGFTVPVGREKPWGTGQAILAAREVINEPFAVINADDYYGQAAYGLLHGHLRTVQDTGCSDYTMVGYSLGKTLSEHGAVSRGICTCDDDGYVSGVSECHGITRDGLDARYVDGDGSETAFSGAALASMNFWGFMPSIFQNLEAEFEAFLSAHGDGLKSEYLIPEVVGTLIKRGVARLKMLESPDTWFGITFREDKPQVSENICRLVEAGHYPQNLLS